MFQKKTLRRLNPRARKLALLHNEAEKLANNLKRLVEQVNEAELAEKALYKIHEAQPRDETEGKGLSWKDKSALSKATENLF